MHPNDVLLDGTRQRVLVYHVVMASRKPKSQPTGILDVVRDIVSPWLGAPAGQSRSVTQAQGLARSAAETLDQTFAGGMIKAGVQGNRALAKQAAVNVAALGTGYVAGKAMQTAAGAAAKTGVPALIANQLTKKTVVVHGSQVPNIKILRPQSGAAIGNTTPHVFVQEITRRNMFDDSLAGRVLHYANETGSAYVSRVPKKDLTSVEKLYGGNYPNYLVSNKPVKVNQEIKIPPNLKKADQIPYLTDKLVPAAKQLGVGSLDIYPVDNLRESKRFVTELAQKNVADLQRKIRYAKYDRIINKAKRR